MSSYFHTRRLFLRLLGAVYLIAFLSLAPQALGLWGEKGILPVAEFLRTIQAHASAPDRFWFFPTVFWFNSSDPALLLVCWLGALFSILIVLDIAPAIFLALDWFLYLSLFTVGGDFLHFQWDVLLLEAGFLAIFFAPLRLKPKPASEEQPSRLILWLFRWLLFRLMFFSGFSKLASGDLTWRSLSALKFYYETQPLPPWTAWFAHQWPGWFHTASCVFMFAVELGVPFLIFMGRRCRQIACVSFLSLQFLIMATGNYGIFNWLTVALCILLLDDSVFSFFGKIPSAKKGKPGWVVYPVFILLLFLSLPKGMKTLRVLAEPYCLVNSYGLFAAMTTERPEILLEGSTDGQTWKAYEFKFKPGDVRRRPVFVQPYHPRLDWQMWFAALGAPEDNPWFSKFCERVLQGSPEVLSLLKNNPFPEHPPRYLRAMLYDYRFSGPSSLKKGVWWISEKKGLYLPVLSIS